MNKLKLFEYILYENEEDEKNVDDVEKADIDTQKIDNDDSVSNNNDTLDNKKVDTNVQKIDNNDNMSNDNNNDNMSKDNNTLNNQNQTVVLSQEEKNQIIINNQENQKLLVVYGNLVNNLDKIIKEQLGPNYSLDAIGSAYENELNEFNQIENSIKSDDLNADIIAKQTEAKTFISENINRINNIINCINKKDINMAIKLLQQCDNEIEKL